MSKHKLGPASKKELQGVHPDLVAVVQRAIEITVQDFSIHNGIRTLAEQKKLVAAGASQTQQRVTRGPGRAVRGPPQGRWSARLHRRASLRAAQSPLPLSQPGLPQWLIIQGRLLGKVFEPSGARTVVVFLALEQQPQPEGCLSRP